MTKIILSTAATKHIIRPAHEEDIPEILSILEQNLIAHKVINIDKLGQSGFLINGFTSDEAKVAILDKDNFIYLVSTDHNEVIGYVVGCDIKKLKSTFQEELALVSKELSDVILSEKVFYLRHIAKNPDKKKVGKELLKALLRQAEDGGYEYIICQIAEKPIQNKVSKAFHEKYGFVCVGYNQNTDKMSGVYLKKVSSI